jgi:hypothetical protein
MNIATIEVICGYCGNEASCVSSLHWYGRDYKSYVWTCPSCDAYVGTHKGSKKPLGTLANGELRKLRSSAHEVIDFYWKNRRGNRSNVYLKLSEYMQLPSAQTHIGMFDNEKCQKVIDGFKQFMEGDEE